MCSLAAQYCLDPERLKRLNRSIGHSLLSSSASQFLEELLIRRKKMMKRIEFPTPIQHSRLLGTLGPRLEWQAPQREMANKLVAHMGLPQSIANRLAARNIRTAKDALSLPEFDLMTLLGVDIKDVKEAVARISEVACPPYQTALSLLEERLMNDASGGRLPTFLTGLDDALGGGIPFGVLTELVGPSGIGKSQFCLKLSLLAALPASYGGLDGRVIYIDTESKFSSRRMIEIGRNSFPKIFHSEGMAQEMAGRIIVLRQTSLSEITER
ncbi:hypothetical protein IEQ34_016833 [Dendrobium chrysotoxum]|uniref:RecA family profile 1 domain-containing protein n=1 Tax=Dendrobium chrysotoxum TaxID=161865 RepID=A0AAV7GGV9_DENCH|nr:hypothetical protein IEQ34_016833 [Dendrobium chrysotoxum]